MQVVLIHVGVTSVIAHIKIGQMHAALESKVLVVSAQGQSALCSAFAHTSAVQPWLDKILFTQKGRLLFIHFSL